MASGFTRRSFLKLSGAVLALTIDADAPTRMAAGTRKWEDMDLSRQGTRFALTFHPENGTLVALQYAGDAFDTNYLLGHGIGNVELRYRVGGGEWLEASSFLSADTRRIEYDDPDAPTMVMVRYEEDSTKSKGIKAISLIERYSLSGDALEWSLSFKNKTGEQIELGDIGLPLLFNTNYVRDSVTTYTQRVIRHSYISGDGSFICVMRPNGVGPYLVLTPLPGTHLEYFRREDGAGAWEGVYTAYIHSAYSGGRETGGTWRQPHTSAILKPADESGDTVTYGFRFRWAHDYDAVRNVLYEEGAFDIKVMPGMTIPRDLEARFALRTRQTVTEIESEFPEDTFIEYLGEKTQDVHLYRAEFSRLGENLLTVRYGENSNLYLEFFVTEPLATLIQKRSAFIASHQQVRDASKWYNGLFSLWDMQERTLRNPDDTGGLYPYMVGGSDDPTLCKATYIAAKNVHYPQAAEIEAVEYYLEHFVWGKLQRSDQETPHPYGIYGSDNWHVNRNSPIGFGSGGHGQEHMWRTFDYTHMILLYYNMYLIARLYPQLTRYLDKDGYLERAIGTARAFYVTPYNIKMGEPWDFRGWTDWAYKQGNFHELIIPSLIDALDEETRHEDAAWLRGEWEKKVKYFVYDHPHPFGSEMFFDTTAFESTHIVAKYGIEHDLKPDENLWQDKNSGEWYSHPSVEKQDFYDFMEREIAANIAARGALETHYYQLGSDIRQQGNSNYLLSYMTQMGGWSIVDYALHYATKSEDTLRLGYASYLASWALVNSGLPENNYGFWFPGAENDGAAGWAFKPEKYGPTWMGLPQGRGIWRYDGEIDSGFCGALRTAATIVVDDSLFGLVAYGGQVHEEDRHINVLPSDGLNQRLHLLNFHPQVQLHLDRDGFAPNTPVVIEQSGREIKFVLENRIESPHFTRCTVMGLTPGEYAFDVRGQEQQRVVVTDVAAITLEIGVEGQTQVPCHLIRL